MDGCPTFGTEMSPRHWVEYLKDLWDPNATNRLR